jgi:hypothetical protein
MPDFLLCNSKLTFQMTMTPDKTNYLTQGPDGVKRLKQGPDLASYRGLSVIHSRSFAMEAGQHPRDILRRRVRTAEFYRIPPSKDNIHHEFELYNEERDTYFSLTFKDLLKMALLGHDEPTASNYSSLLHKVYEQAVDAHKSSALTGSGLLLGAKPYQPPAGKFPPGYLQGKFREIDAYLQDVKNSIQAVPPQINKFIRDCTQCASFFCKPYVIPAFTFGAKVVELNENIFFQVQHHVQSVMDADPRYDVMSLTGTLLETYRNEQVYAVPRLQTKGEFFEIYSKLKTQDLYDPFGRDKPVVRHGSAEWFAAYAFYMTCFQRQGVPMDFFDFPPGYALPPNADGKVTTQMLNYLDSLPLNLNQRQVDISSQFLSSTPGYGNVNHPFWLNASSLDEDNFNRNHATAGAGATFFNSCVRRNNPEAFYGAFLITWELLSVLMVPVTLNGNSMTGIEAIIQCKRSLDMTGFNTFWDHVSQAMENYASNAIVMTLTFQNNVVEVITNMYQQLEGLGINFTRAQQTYPTQVVLAQHGIDTWPMGITTLSRAGHLYNASSEGIQFQAHKALLQTSYGHLNIEFLLRMQVRGRLDVRWGNLRTVNEMGVTHAVTSNNPRDISAYTNGFIQSLYNRIFGTPAVYQEFFNYMSNTLGGAFSPAVKIEEAARLMARNMSEHEAAILGFATAPEADRVKSLDHVAAGPALSHVTLFHHDSFEEPVTPPEAELLEQAKVRLEDVEIVIVRPNIEHHMLGLIMGLGGSELGNTLWGQTELSVYDDSMHGIWGMSYKYHERAIVFNEKNLIRLWDIAYDGYNGGKDDTYVDWTEPDEGVPNSYNQFKRHTINTNSNYRGPSMMVMAFVHDQRSAEFEAHFRRNWPSPIVYHETHDYHNPQHREAVLQLPVDSENVEVINADEYRVFNNPLYTSYAHYREKMPAFNELHKQRKGAGQSSVDADTPQDSLAFQGSMRIKRKGGTVQEIHGSGHHGPDYVGVASVRAGKGQKVQAQAPALYRMV